MALYIPAGRRRRRTIVIATASLVAGLLIGLLGGRATAPTPQDEVSAIQEDARQTAAALRVLALHDQADTVGSQGADDGGVDVVLTRVREELDAELDRAIWLTDAQRTALLDGLDELEAIPDRTSSAFGEAADAYAGQIEQTFGLASEVVPPP